MIDEIPTRVGEEAVGCSETRVYVPSILVPTADFPHGLLRGSVPIPSGLVTPGGPGNPGPGDHCVGRVDVITEQEPFEHTLE